MDELVSPRDVFGTGAPRALRTGRLDLLPLAVEHAVEMAAVLSDPGLHTFIGGSPATPEALRSRYERLVAGSPDPDVSWWNWVIRLREEDCLVGTVQATVGRTGDSRPVAEIAWVVGAPWQGRGIATEAADALATWLSQDEASGVSGASGVSRASGVSGAAAVIAHIHPDHLASAAVAAAIGLTPADQWQDGEQRWQRKGEHLPG